MAKNKNLAEEKMKDNLGKRYSKLAIWSFVLGLIGFVLPKLPLDYLFSYQTIGYLIFVMLIIPIFSLIFGIMALIRIREDNMLKGKTLAIIGVIIACLVLLLDLIGAMILL